MAKSFPETIHYYVFALRNAYLDDTGILPESEAATRGLEWVARPENFHSVRIARQWSLNHINPLKQFDVIKKKAVPGQMTLSRYQWIAAYLWRSVRNGQSLSDVTAEARSRAVVAALSLDDQRLSIHAVVTLTMIDTLNLYSYFLECFSL